MQDDTVEEVFTCNEILDHINNSEEEDLVEWNFQAIAAHEGPLPQSHPDCNGFFYNLRIEGENKEIAEKPFNTIAANNPVSCTAHGRDHDLPNLTRWKRFKFLAKRQKKLLRLQN